MHCKNIAAHAFFCLLIQRYNKQLKFSIKKWKKLKMKKILFSLIALSLGFISSFAQDSTQLAAWSSFKNQNGQKWIIRWDEKTGTPASLYSGKTKHYSGNAEDIAKTFLKENIKLMKMKPNLSDLKFIQTRTHRDIKHVKFQQTYNGIPIEMAEYLVHILPDGSVDMANGTYYPQIDISTKSAITAQQAFAIAMNNLGNNVVIRGDTIAALIIYPDSSLFVLSWKLLIPAEEPYGAWVFYIDAVSGQIIQRYNNIHNVNGSGNVYPTHPGISSVTNVTLSRLDGTGYLRGNYANILNNVSSRAYSSNNSFNYSSADTHFDEANVYYHIDCYRGNYLAGLGFDGVGQITATVHENTYPGPDNAWFDPSNGQLYFGDGTPAEGVYDFAKEDKIIYHEYTHAMSNSIANLYYWYTESGAIEEGNADYFPGSYTSRSIICDYAAPSYARDMNNPSPYSHYSQLPKDPNTGLANAEPHDGGSFWSAALWDLHNTGSIGASVTDWLVYGGLYRVTTNATFLSYSEAILAEDLSVYAGSHIAAIQNCFAQRGIGRTGTIAQNTTWSDVISIIGSVTVNSGVTLTITAGTNVFFPNNASLVINGTLTAVGTSTNKITFTSLSGNSPNSWGTITLSGAGASGSTLKYANVKYGTKVEAANTSNITIQYCNIDTTYDGIYFYNSSGSILNNTITTNSIGHGIRIEGGSTATCNDNVITKTNANRNGVGILFGGGSGGYAARNDIYHWDWGIGAIWSSSPSSYSSYYIRKNNRIRNCNTGLMVYRLSYPTFGIPAPIDYYNWNSISGNSYNAKVGTYYPEYESRLFACNNWWGSNPPNTSLFQVGSSSQFYYNPYLYVDPWAGMAKVIASNNESPTKEEGISKPSTEEIESFLYGIELRLQNKYSEAKDYFISYIANNPDKQAAYVELYNCYNKETADDIIKFFNALPEKASKDHKLLLSYLYLKNGDFKNAKEVNNTLITEKPNTQLATREKLNNVYIALYNEGNINEAITIFNEVLNKIELSTPMELSLVHQAIETYGKTYGKEIKSLFTLPYFDSSEEALNKQEVLDKIGIPDKYALLDNYPNPFNPVTTINYQLPKSGSVTLKIFDILGNEVKTLVNENKEMGRYTVQFDASSLASGMYVYQLRANDYTSTKKMMLLK